MASGSVSPRAPGTWSWKWPEECISEGSGHVELEMASGVYLPDWAGDRATLPVSLVASSWVVCPRGGKWQEMRGAERFYFPFGLLLSQRE